MSAFLLKVLQRAHFFGKWDEDGMRICVYFVIIIQWKKSTLIEILTTENFFINRIPFHVTVNKPDADLSEDELLIGSLLLRHLQILQFNAHEVGD